MPNFVNDACFAVQMSSYNVINTNLHDNHDIRFMINVAILKAMLGSWNETTSFVETQLLLFYLHVRIVPPNEINVPAKLFLSVNWENYPEIKSISERFGICSVMKTYN
jgi:hypothetical protein